MQNLLQFLQLYNDDGLQMMHERLKDPISDTSNQLQSAIRQEKAARKQKMVAIPQIKNDRINSKLLKTKSDENNSVPLNENELRPKEAVDSNEIDSNFSAQINVGKSKNENDQPKSAYLREWRDRYLVDMSKVFGRKRSQPRNMLSRHKYEALLDRVKVVERIRREDGQVPAHLAVIGEKYRIVRKKSANDEFAKDFLAEKGTGRMLLSVDDLFEVLHKYHLITGHGRSISMYNVARKKYANITVECILIFLVGCLECKKWNKNERKLATLLRPNQHKERRIDYACFYQFGAEAISCRHCFYRRSVETPGKPTNALRSHLKKYHLEVLEEYRTRILAATDGGTMAKTDNEIGQNGQIDQNGEIEQNGEINQNGEIEQNGEINQNGEIEQNGPKTPSEQNTDLEL